MTSSVESLYEMFLSDPDIVATATKSREEIAFGEAKQRFIQSMNNHKALSLAKSGPVEDLLSFLRYGNLLKADNDILRRNPTTNKLSVDAPEAAGVSHEDLVNHLKDEFMRMHRPEGDTEFPHTFDDIANDPELSNEALQTARLTQDNLYLHGLRPGRQGEYSPEEEVEGDDNVEKVEDDDEEEGTEGEEAVPKEELDAEDTGGVAKYGVDFAEATAQHGMHQDTPLNMPGGPVIGYDALKHISDRAQTPEAKDHMESLNHAVANFNSTQLGLQQGTPIDGHDWDSIDPTAPGQSFRATHEQKSLNHLRRIAVGLKYAAENRDAFSHPGDDGNVVHQHTFSPLQTWHLDNVQGPEGSKDKLRQEVLSQYDFKQHHGNPPAVDDLIQSSADKLGLTLGTPSDDLLRRDNAHRSELPRGDTLTRRFVEPGETRPEDMSMEQLVSWAMGLDVTPEEFTKVTNEGVESGRYNNEDVDNALLSLTNMPKSREDLASMLGDVEKFSSHAEMEEAATKHMGEFANIITDPVTGIKEYNPEKAKEQMPPPTRLDSEHKDQREAETKIRVEEHASRERQQKATREMDTGDREPALATQGRPPGVGFKEGHSPHFPGEEGMRLFSSDIQQDYGRFRPIMQSLITLGVPLSDFTNPSGPKTEDTGVFTDNQPVWSLHTFQRGLRKWGFINHDDSITGETGKNNTPRIMPGQPFERKVQGRTEQWGGSGHQAYNRRQALFKNFDLPAERGGATPEQREALDAVKTTKRVKDDDAPGGWRTVELTGREAILHHLDSSQNTGQWINAMGYKKETRKSKAGNEYTKNARPSENYKTVPEKNTKEDSFNWDLARPDWSPEQVEFFHNNISKEGDSNLGTAQNAPKFVKREGGDRNLESKHLDRLLGMAADEHGGVLGGEGKNTTFASEKDIDDLAEYPPLRGYQRGSAYPGLDFNEQDVQDNMRVSAERKQQIAEHPNSRATFIANMKQQFYAAHEGQHDVDYHTINKWFKDNEHITDKDIPVPQHLEGKLESLPTPPSTSAVNALQAAVQSRLPGSRGAEATPTPEEPAAAASPFAGGDTGARPVPEEIGDNRQFDAAGEAQGQHDQAKEDGWGSDIDEVEDDHFSPEGAQHKPMGYSHEVQAYAEKQQKDLGIPLVMDTLGHQGQPHDDIYDHHGLGDEDPVTLDHVKDYIKSKTGAEAPRADWEEGEGEVPATPSPTPPSDQPEAADDPEEIGGANVRVVDGVTAVRNAHDAKEGISMLRRGGDTHYGNPFGVGDRTFGVHNVETNQNAVDAHAAWLHKSPEYAKDSRTGDLLSYWDRDAGESKNIWLGEGEGPKGEQPVKPEQRDWILQQIKSGALNNKDLLYHQEIRNTEGGRSHASNIEDMVNTHQGNPAGEDFREDYPEGEGVEQQPPTAAPAEQPETADEPAAPTPAQPSAGAVPREPQEVVDAAAETPSPVRPVSGGADDDGIHPDHTPVDNVNLTGEDTEKEFNDAKEVHDKATEEYNTIKENMDKQHAINAEVKEKIRATPNSEQYPGMDVDLGHKPVDHQPLYGAFERQQNAYVRMREAEALHTGRPIDKGQAFMPHPGTPGTEGDLHQFPEKPISQNQAPSAQILLGDLHARRANINARQDDITAAENRSPNDESWYKDLPEGETLTPHASDAQVFKPYRNPSEKMGASVKQLETERRSPLPPAPDMVRQFPGREEHLGGEGGWGSWVTGEEANQDHRAFIRDRKLREMKSNADYASTYYEATHTKLREELPEPHSQDQMYERIRENGGLATDKDGNDISLEGHEERYPVHGQRNYGAYSMNKVENSTYNDPSQDGDEHYIDAHRPHGISDEEYEALKQRVHTNAAARGVRTPPPGVDPETGEILPPEEPAPTAPPTAGPDDAPTERRQVTVTQADIDAERARQEAATPDAFDPTAGAPRPGESQEERERRVEEEAQVEEQDTQHGELQSDPTNQVANSPTPHGYTSIPDNPRDMTEQAKEDQMQAMVEHLKPRMKNQAAVNYLQGLRDTMISHVRKPSDYGSIAEDGRWGEHSRANPSALGRLQKLEKMLVDNDFNGVGIRELAHWGNGNGLYYRAVGVEGADKQLRMFHTKGYGAKSNSGLNPVHDSSLLNDLDPEDSVGIKKLEEQNYNTEWYYINVLGKPPAEAKDLAKAHREEMWREDHGSRLGYKGEPGGVPERGEGSGTVGGRGTGRGAGGGGRGTGGGGGAMPPTPEHVEASIRTLIDKHDYTQDWVDDIYKRNHSEEANKIIQNEANRVALKEGGQDKHALDKKEMKVEEAPTFVDGVTDPTHALRTAYVFGHKLREHGVEVSPKVMEGWQRLAAQARHAGGDSKRIEQEMKEFGNDFGGPDHLEAVAKKDDNIRMQTNEVNGLLGNPARQRAAWQDQNHNPHRSHTFDNETGEHTGTRYRQIDGTGKAKKREENYDDVAPGGSPLPGKRHNPIQQKPVEIPVDPDAPSVTDATKTLSDAKAAFDEHEAIHNVNRNASFTHSKAYNKMSADRDALREKNASIHEEAKNVEQTYNDRFSVPLQMRGRFENEEEKAKKYYTEKVLPAREKSNKAKQAEQEMSDASAKYFDENVNPAFAKADESRLNVSASLAAHKTAKEAHDSVTETAQRMETDHGDAPFQPGLTTAQRSTYNQLHKDIQQHKLTAQSPEEREAGNATLDGRKQAFHDSLPSSHKGLDPTDISGSMVNHPHFGALNEDKETQGNHAGQAWREHHEEKARLTADHARLTDDLSKLHPEHDAFAHEQKSTEVATAKQKVDDHVASWGTRGSRSMGMPSPEELKGSNPHGDLEYVEGVGLVSKTAHNQILNSLQGHEGFLHTGVGEDGSGKPLVYHNDGVTPKEGHVLVTHGGVHPVRYKAQYSQEKDDGIDKNDERTLGLGHDLHNAITSGHPDIEHHANGSHIRSLENVLPQLSEHNTAKLSQQAQVSRPTPTASTPSQPSATGGKRTALGKLGDFVGSVRRAAKAQPTVGGAIGAANKFAGRMINEQEIATEAGQVTAGGWSGSNVIRGRAGHTPTATGRAIQGLKATFGTSDMKANAAAQHLENVTNVAQAHLQGTTTPPVPKSFGE